MGASRESDPRANRVVTYVCKTQQRVIFRSSFLNNAASSEVFRLPIPIRETFDPRVAH